MPISHPPTASVWANDLRPIGPKDWNYHRAAHLLERAGFGGAPEEIHKLAVMTPADAVASLVDYETIDDSGLPAFEPSGIYPHGHKLVPLQDVVLEGILTGKAYGVKATQDGPLKYQPAINEFYTLLISEHAEMGRAGQWWGERMLLTPRPLQEKLTLFWHGHFATSQEKVANYELMLGQIETLREHANGSFREMLVAIAQDPAMLIWLDNRENVKGKPNENFAREIMELFTLGEGQGYTESDIREIARAFTGWTMRPIRTVQDKAEFINDPGLHDDGVKTFLGNTGNFNGYDAINAILKQPAAPKFLTRKLYQYFVREDLSPEVHARLAGLLLKNNYQLKPLLKTIFLSRDFYSQPSTGTHIKDPVDLVVSTYRKLGLCRLPGVPGFNDVTGSLGQVLFYPPNVAGWPGGHSWINPAALLARGNSMYVLMFPDPASYGAPDKVVAEGYRQIPLMFRQYNITPHLWNARSQRMEPVSYTEYDHFLAGLNAGPMKAMGYTSPQKSPDIKKKEEETPMTSSMPKGDKSAINQMSEGETYNLAVGVYTGFVEAYNRVKPIPRIPAHLSTAALLHSGGVSTVEGAVEALCSRFLSIELHPDRRAAIITFLKGELKSGKLDYRSQNLERALRQTVHLVLSAPEYQLT